MTTPVAGPDGRLRCPWAVAAEIYTAYHDQEWGRPCHDDDAMFERICLEGFQAGLSWLTVLRKRPAFRHAFADFRIEAVAAFDDEDVRRLLADAAIVRNRAKITAAITNARAVGQLPTGLAEHLWSFAPTPDPAWHRPATVAEIPATSPESVAMAGDLRQRGFRFFGPITAYALMQAVGMVDDHLRDCSVRPGS
jgi:DNA-3-methyladenine glycosylase I